MDPATYIQLLSIFSFQVFFISSETGLNICASIPMEELAHSRFCTELRQYTAMITVPPERPSSTRELLPNMEVGCKVLGFVTCLPKSVWSPVTDSLMLQSPPGSQWQHGAWQKVHAKSVCAELNWLTSGYPYKADSALHAEQLWELSQALLCLGKQIGKKKKGLEKSHSRCVLCLNEAFFCCWSNFKKSPSSSSHDPISTLVTGWKDFIWGLVKTPVKGIPMPPSPHTFLLFHKKL